MNVFEGLLLFVISFIAINFVFDLFYNLFLKKEDTEDIIDHP